MAVLVERSVWGADVACCVWQDEELFFKEYAESHKKLSELG